ncbi:hypothetical protein SEPCBS57363_000558 [Sporothrix epigloea]|uniref:Major facilitator superfamily transporter n=1 Tax=Sporothrix epigloea TaxID=1892477 RepID=A0ABP0D5E0_9PEZI
MASPSNSSLESLRTAKSGSPDGSKSIAGVTGLDSDPNAANDATTAKASQYRTVRDIPYQLRDHIRVFLEEKMYGDAIHLLTSLVAAGGSVGLQLPSADSATTVTTSNSPVWLPPASHLSVLASLAVHPAYTTRPQDGTDLRVAGHALQYLRHVLTVAGPVSSEMTSAFEFRDAQGRRTSAARAAAARARGVATIGRDRDPSNRTNSNSGESNTAGRASGTNSSRRQLRASAGRSSLLTGDYVDSQTMSWSDDESGRGGKQSRPKKKGRDSRENKSLREREKTEGNDWNSGDIDDDDDFADEENDEDAVSSRMATRDGVWMLGQSFWRVAAWALTCSVREPERWRCWKPWLTLLVDVIEADLVERLQGMENGDDDGDLYDSMLFQYLSDDSGSGGSGSGSTTHLRHLVSVILADGSQPTLAREIFDKETVVTSDSKTSTTGSMIRPARALDLDNDKFGDYSDDEESAPSTPEMSPSPLPSGKKGSTSKKSSPEVKIADLNENPGFLESLPLRRRIFYLVALGTLYFPAAFASSDAFHRAAAQVLREAEISVYTAFLAAPPPPPSSSSFTSPVLLPPDNIFAGLLRHILFTYLPTSAPKPHIVDPENGVTALPSPRVLERCFLPFAANTVLLGPNVRMALAVESLFRITWQPTVSSTASSAKENEEKLWSPALQTAAEAGVQARETRSKSSGGKVEAYGRNLIKRSGIRLLAMVRLAQLDAGEPEMVMDTRVEGL